ncbi:MAG: N-acetyltransferase family protein [Desulfovibrionaceae bacterium]
MPAAIRPAREADLDALVALLGQLFSIEADFAVDAAKQRRGLALLLECRDAVVLVAEERGEAVAMVSGQVVVSTAEGGPAVLAEDLVVRDGMRGRGLGRALMAALADWASRRGATRMQLLADVSNTPALDFYRRIGWRSTDLVCLRDTLATGAQE